MKKLVWLWKYFWGFGIRIKYDERVKEDTGLLCGHVLYLPKYFEEKLKK